MEMRTLLVHIFGAINGTLLTSEDSHHQQHVVVNLSVSQLMRRDVQLMQDAPLQQQLGGGGLGKVTQEQGQQGQGTYDAHGAALYMLAVVLVYGLSIVLLIGSLIKCHKRRSELDSWDYEDRQMARYMQQMRDLKEESVRETYRQLKRTIMRSVSWKIPSTSAAASAAASPGGVLAQHQPLIQAAADDVTVHHQSVLASTDSTQSLTSSTYPLMMSRGRDDSIQSDVHFMLSVIPPSMIATAASDVSMAAAAAAAAGHRVVPHVVPVHATVEVELASDDPSDDGNSLVSIAVTDVATDVEEPLVQTSSTCADDGYHPNAAGAGAGAEPATQAAAAAKKAWKLLTVTSSLDVPDTPSAESADVSPAASDVSTSWTFRDDSTSSVAS